MQPVHSHLTLSGLLLSVLLLASALWADEAHAACQQVGGDWYNMTCSTRAEARAAAESSYIVSTAHYICSPGVVEQGDNRYLARNVMRRSASSSGSCSTINLAYHYPPGQALCPTGQEWLTGTGCITPCSARPPITRGKLLAMGNSTFCDNGCKFSSPGGSATVVVNLGNGTPINVFTDGELTPTGATCTVNDPGDLPNTAPIPTADSLQPLCVPDPSGLTQCVYPDGKHCAKASNGKQFCWEPMENGTKKSGNEAMTKAPDVALPNAPLQNPSNNGNWEQKAQASQSITTNNVTNNTTITSYESSYGKQGTDSGSTNEDGTEEGGEGEDGGISGGGDCAEVPVCSGTACNAMEYAMVMQQWKTRCENPIAEGFAGMGGDGDGTEGGTGNGTGGGGIFVGTEEQSFADNLIVYTPGTLGYDFTVEGQQFVMPQELLDLIPVIRWLIIAAATLLAIKIAWGDA